MLGISMRMDNFRYASGASELRDSLDHAWWAFLEKALPGRVVLPLPNSRPLLEALLASLPFSGFILTGGPDMGDYPDRDACEAEILDFAQASAMPVLGICRGAQFINLRLGGSLSRREGHIATSHEIALASGARIDVNSYHANAIAPSGLAPGLKPRAWSQEGDVEAFRSKNGLLNGAMWHPEREKEAMEIDIMLFRKIFGGAA